jgi:3-hydroxybutyryl-CoA dehydrogenase
MIEKHKGQIGIIGAGTMGGGIAHVAAAAGFPVLLYDISDLILEKGIARLRDILRRSVQKRHMTARELTEILTRIRTTIHLEEFGSAQAIIEAAPELLNLKQDLFKRLDRIAKPQAILASNTSSLSVTAIGRETQHPERLVGMHFFNPPPLMALVEIVQGDLTSKKTVEEAEALARALGKVPVRVKDTPGFMVNRIARPFYNEALRLVSDRVASVEQIDRIVKLEGRFRMGPFELMDLIGIDINLTVTQSLYDSFFQEPKFRPSPLQERMVQSGRLGRKTGKGFYHYEKKPLVTAHKD